MSTKVKIETAKGVMIAELYDNETPITVNNFKKLIKTFFRWNSWKARNIFL